MNQTIIGTAIFDQENTEHIVKVLISSVRQLQQGIDDHCCLIASLLEGSIDEKTLSPQSKLCLGRLREQILKDAIKDAIEILEESRKAFKSKQLALLRKKLTQVLIDTD